MKSVSRVTLFCGNCGGKFERMACELTRGRGQFCSKACSSAAKAKQIVLTCERCGKTFSRKRSEVGLHSFCSELCYKADKDARATSYAKEGERHEHRVVAERMIGRELRRDEVVHHKNGNRRDNRPENLQVMTRVEHTRHHSSGENSHWNRAKKAARQGEGKCQVN